MIVLRKQTAQSEKLDQIIPACACLCGPARRQEDIGYGG